MLSTEQKEKLKSKNGRAGTDRARALVSRGLLTLLIFTCSWLISACRQDMQDQPRYEVYEPSTFFTDGQASRPLVEGTVPRGTQFREMGSYFYTGKEPGAAQASTGSQTGMSGTSSTSTGGVETRGANIPSSAGGGAQPTGDVNVRGNTAGGVPGSQASAQSGPDVFPFPVTAEVLQRGQERFNAYCAMCHGMTGEGDGMIVRRGFRRPPSFHSEQLREGTASAAHFFDVITNGWGAMPAYNAMIPAEDRWKVIAYVRALQLSRRGKIEDVPADRRGTLGSRNGNGQPPGGSGGSSSGEPHGGPAH